MPELTTEARRQIVAGLVRRNPAATVAAVRRAVRDAGHQVGDGTVRKDMERVRGEIAREEIQRRQEVVATLLVRKLTYREIQRGLANAGFTVSIWTVERDIEAVRQIWKERIAAPLEELRASEIAEMEDMERTAAQEMAGVDKGDHAARARYIETRLKIKARKHAVLGLDKPAELKHSGEVGIRFEEYGADAPDDPDDADDGGGSGG